MTASEEEIWKGCLRGDPKYQKELYIKYSKKMFAVCLRYSNNHDHAADILQDGFIKVFSSLSGFKGMGSFEGWIRRIIVNTALETFRKTESKYRFEDIEDFREDLSEGVDFTKYDMNYILSKIQQLAPGYRMVFNLFIIEGYQHHEIAEMLGISENTSKSQLSRARKILQESLKGHNIEK